MRQFRAGPRPQSAAQPRQQRGELHALQHLPEGEPLPRLVGEEPPEVLPPEPVRRDFGRRQPGPAGVHRPLPLCGVQPLVDPQQHRPVPGEEQQPVRPQLPAEALHEPAVPHGEQPAVDIAVLPGPAVLLQPVVQPGIHQSPVQAAHDGGHVLRPVRRPGPVDVFIREGRPARGLGLALVRPGVVPHVGAGAARPQELLGQAVEAAPAFGAAPLPGDEAGGKGPETAAVQQGRHSLLLQVHVREDGQGLALPPQGRHHREEVGVCPAQVELQLTLRSHALLWGQAGLRGQDSPDLL